MIENITICKNKHELNKALDKIGSWQDISREFNCNISDYKYPVLVQYLGRSDYDGSHERFVIIDQNDKGKILQFLGIL